ncbi:MAG: MlaD family protein [Bacteroidia bacterium]|nr:MlaD family protein [Bacteroidia bacterium]
MDTHSIAFKIRLGLFIIGGLALCVLALFIIGKQKNLFDPVFRVTSSFNNVSGLQVGNNVRFSGITVGTVDNISIINDSTVRVDMLVKKSVQRFIKKDSEVAIGSEGIIGDRLVIITQGGNESLMAKDGQFLTSKEPVETDAIMASLQETAVNAAVITNQLAEIMVKINQGKGTLSRLIEDESIAENLNQTIVNLKSSSHGLDENMTAAKSNFLFKGFFKNKAKEAQKRKDAVQERKDSVIKARNKDK